MMNFRTLKEYIREVSNQNITERKESRLLHFAMLLKDAIPSIDRRRIFH